MEHKIEDYIRPGARAHLVGVGGVSMAPLAEVLNGRGMAVTEIGRASCRERV